MDAFKSRKSVVEHDGKLFIKTLRRCWADLQGDNRFRFVEVSLVRQAGDKLMVSYNDSRLQVTATQLYGKCS